jgi:hypothetical protein
VLGCAESAVAWRVYTARRRLLKFFRREAHESGRA